MNPSQRHAKCKDVLKQASCRNERFYLCQALLHVIKLAIFQQDLTVISLSNSPPQRHEKLDPY